MKMFKRKIKLSVLLSRGVCYRIFIILMNLIFNIFALKAIVQLFAEHYFSSAIIYTIIWNIINTLLYYIFHYAFDRTFKIGKGDLE